MRSSVVHRWSGMPQIGAAVSASISRSAATERAAPEAGADRPELFCIFDL
jgi:hypothetical protein